MSEYAITVHQLGKRFVLGQRGLSRGLHQVYEDTLRRTVARLKGGPRQDSNSGQVLWALRDVNLQIRHGEIVGLIGHNGAG
ncbi:MAG TPA: hypothetical protein VFG52_11035, partial [Xanthomonadales bacterium]|nr:hypothetical protein [Xanthomonadales bacterium]